MNSIFVPQVSGYRTPSSVALVIIMVDIVMVEKHLMYSALHCCSDCMVETT
jgi:hypothetical protein